MKRACLSGHPESVELLLEKGANVTAVDNEGRTSLHSSTINGHVSCISLLLQHGVDPTKIDKKGLPCSLQLL